MKKVFIGSLVFVLFLVAGIALAQQATTPAPAPAAPAPAQAAPAPAAPAPAQAAPAPAATPTAKAAAPAAGLTITRMEIAGSVENREPVGIAATFPATTEKVSCFLEFKNVANEAKVNVVWTLGQNEMGSVSLTVKPLAKFRTWANKSLGGMKGDWKVEVKDEAGTVLKSATFKVE